MGSVGAYSLVARKIDPPAAWLMVPYLGWCGFAAALNEEIMRRNP
jgi:tryptophan-rich sensory protein